MLSSDPEMFPKAESDCIRPRASERTLRGTLSAGLFVTAFYGVVDGGSGEVRFCNAGHHPPLLLRAATGEFETLRGGGPGLGIVEEARYPECRTRMEMGDMLTIFTDGVLEAISPPGEMFGIERPRRLLMSLSGRPSQS